MAEGDTYDGIIYLIICLIDGSIYIGSTKYLVARVSGHKNKARTGTSPFYEAIRKHGWANFRVEVVKRGMWANRSALIAEEDAYQAEQRALGKVVLNKQRSQHDKKSPETRAAMSRAKLGVATKHGHCAQHNGSWQFVYRSEGKNVSKSFSIGRYGFWSAKERAQQLRKQIYPAWEPNAEEEFTEQLLQLEW